MSIPDYRNVHGVKSLNYWRMKINRVDRVYKDEFKKELEDSIHKRKEKHRLKSTPSSY